MKKTMKYAISIFFVISMSSFLWAGNRKMVENRVDELDRLNREAVKQVAGEPESGVINIKVRVIPEKNGWRIESFDEKKQPATDALQPGRDEDGTFTLSEGIKRLSKKKPSITPYRNFGNEGEYISFKDAIIRLNRNK
jgi:hypothetical protein